MLGYSCTAAAEVSSSGSTNESPGFSRHATVESLSEVVPVTGNRILYTMPSQRPKGNHRFPRIMQDLGGTKNMKTYSFHSKTCNLKPVSDQASKLVHIRPGCRFRGSPDGMVYRMNNSYVEQLRI
jgi:hypothetical protein